MACSSSELKTSCDASIISLSGNAVHQTEEIATPSCEEELNNLRHRIATSKYANKPSDDALAAHAPLIPEARK